jgi:hypothetical protein
MLGAQIMESLMSLAIRAGEELGSGGLAWGMYNLFKLKPKQLSQKVQRILDQQL